MVPFDKRDGFIWYNGQIVDWQDATVHVLNHGLHYASSVFEGVAVYGGKIFKLREHTERLIKSAEILDMESPYSLEELEEAQRTIVKKSNIDNGYIRPLVWRGSEKMAISASENKANVAIATWTWSNYYKKDAKTVGIDLVFADYKRPSPETAPCHAKAAGLYMICTISKQMAERKGYNEVLMLDYRGYIAEASSANMFMIINDELHTPKADCFLNGITRQTVIELAKRAGITVIERHIKPEELHNVQDMFLTGTTVEITRVNSVTNDKMNKKYQFNTHPITLNLIDLYKQEIEDKAA